MKKYIILYEKDENCLESESISIEANGLKDLITKFETETKRSWVTTVIDWREAKIQD